MSNVNKFAALDSDDEDTPRQVTSKQNNESKVLAKEQDKGRDVARNGRNKGVPKKETGRHVSGTGRGRGNKKRGAGANNWGNTKNRNDLDIEADIENSAGMDFDSEAARAEAEAAAAAAAAEAEAEAKLMTLEQYEAQRAAARGNSDLFGEKKSDRTVGDIDGKKLTKDGKTPDFIESNFEKVHVKKTSGRKKNLLTDVGFVSQPTRDEGDRRGRGGRGRGDRGGRGGRGRGGRGRGGRGGRGGRAPNVADTNAFPSL